MAISDFYLCDKCDSRTFYDANLDYSEGNENKLTNKPWPNGDVGYMYVLCKQCALKSEGK